MLSLLYILSVLQYRKVSGLSREAMLKVQHQKWMKLLRYIQKHSPYYAKLIQGINKPLFQIQPHDFPILTKQILEEHFDRIVTDPRIKFKDLVEFSKTHSPEDLYLNRYHIMKTSGTTGEPHYFLSSTKEVIQSVAPSVARGPAIQRKPPIKICMLGYKNSYSSSTQNMSICNKIWITRKLVQYHLVSMDQPFEDVLAELNSLQPHIVSGYTKLLLLLADAQRLGKLNIHPDALESGGEPLLNTDRTYLKEVFAGCVVNNNYGSTEGSSMGICRDGENSLELFEDHLIYDLLSDETHITNLDNYTMPLIRYQMNDVLTPDSTIIPTPFRHVNCGVGRSNGIHYFTTLENNKITIHPIEVDPLMPKGIKTFSMTCDKPNSVTYFIFLDEKSHAEEASIKAATRVMLTDFFASKGLNCIDITVEIASDYHINSQSLKSELWRNAVFQNPTHNTVPDRTDLT